MLLLFLRLQLLPGKCFHSRTLTLTSPKLVSPVAPLTTKDLGVWDPELKAFEEIASTLWICLGSGSEF